MALNWMSPIGLGPPTLTLLPLMRRSRYSLVRAQFCVKLIQPPEPCEWVLIWATSNRVKFTQAALAMCSPRCWAQRARMSYTSVTIFSVTSWRVRKFEDGAHSLSCRSSFKSYTCGPTNANCLRSFRILT